MDKGDFSGLEGNLAYIQKEYENLLDIKNKFQPWYESFVIMLKYVAIGILWITLSDKLVSYIVKDAEKLKVIQLYKGWIYVLITGAIFFLIVKKVLTLYLKSIDKILAGYEELFMAHEELMAMNEDLTSMNGDLRQYIHIIEVQKNDLEISKQKYELAIEGANDGIWDWDFKANTYSLPLKWKKPVGVS